MIGRVGLSACAAIFVAAVGVPRCMAGLQRGGRFAAHYLVAVARRRSLESLGVSFLLLPVVALCRKALRSLRLLRFSRGATGYQRGENDRCRDPTWNRPKHVRTLPKDGSECLALVEVCKGSRRSDRQPGVGVCPPALPHYIDGMLRWLLWFVLLPLMLPLKLLAALVDKLRPVTALHFRLAGVLPDVSATAGSLTNRTPPLMQLLLALEQAAADPRLRRVVLHIEGVVCGLGQAEELRRALYRVRGRGKEVVVLADGLGLVGYWIALGASRIVLSPTGSLDVAGVASQFTLFKGLLDKVGVRARLLAKGRYKSMREVFAEEQLSEANREMLESLVQDLYAQLQERIVEARGLVAESVPAVIDQGPYRAEEAKAHGLVDELAYVRDVLNGFKEDKTHRGAGPLAYLRRRQRTWTPLRLPTIAVIEVSGSIRMGKDQYGARGKRATGATSFLDAVGRIAKDKRTRGLLLRVNSPGGSALASDLMWHGLAQAKKERPLAVSMGDVAASGGYYVSNVKGAHIYANDSTLTGSIGVVGGKIEVRGLYEKLGLVNHVIRAGKNASFHSPTDDWTEEQLQKMQRDIDALYNDFVDKMAQGRDKAFAELEQVAQGRVWTGRQGTANGLVDESGGLLAAIAHLRAGLGLPEGASLHFKMPERPGALSLLLARISPSGSASPLSFGSRWLQPLLALAGAEVQEPPAEEHLWCRLPFDIRLF